MLAFSLLMLSLLVVQTRSDYGDVKSSSISSSFSAFDALLADSSSGKNKFDVSPPHIAAAALSGQVTIHFVGGSKVWHATHSSYGFIRLLNQEFEQMQKSLRLNFTIRAIGNGHKDRDIAYIADQFEADLLNAKNKDKNKNINGGDAARSSLPRLVVLMVGDDDVVLGDESEWSSGGGGSSRREAHFQQHYERLLEIIYKGSRAPVLPCTLLLHGERNIGGNTYDSRMGKLDDMISLAVSKYKSRFNVVKDGVRAIHVYDPLNLRGVLYRYLLSVNHDNVAQSHVTFNGQHLNENGNALVALAVLNRLCISTSEKSRSHLLGLNFANSTIGSLQQLLQQRIEYSTQVRRKLDIFQSLQAEARADGSVEAM